MYYELRESKSRLQPLKPREYICIIKYNFYQTSDYDSKILALIHFVYYQVHTHYPSPCCYDVSENGFCLRPQVSAYSGLICGLGASTNDGLNE